MSSRFNLHDKISKVESSRKKQKCNHPDLHINLYINYFLGVFINKQTYTKLERLLHEEHISPKGLKDQCVPFSLSLLAEAIEPNTKLFDDTQIHQITGLGQHIFLKDASKVVECIFPSIDISGKKSGLPFKFKKIYDSNIYNYFVGLGESLIENIFKPFLKRYPCKQTILSKNKDYVVIPYGYNLYSKISKKNIGHEILMVIDLSKLYEYSHNIHLISLRFNEIILFVDNLFSDRGIVNYETWTSSNLTSFLQNVETWKNPSKPKNLQVNYQHGHPKVKLWNNMN